MPDWPDDPDALASELNESVAAGPVSPGGELAAAAGV